MLNAATYVSLVLFVGKRRRGVSHGMKLIGLHVRAVYLHQQFVDALLCIILLVFARHCDDGHLAVKMVENDDVAIEDIIHVGSVVLLHRHILHGNVLEVTHGIECGISVESAEAGRVACDVEVRQELVDGMVRAVLLVHLMFRYRTVGICADALPVCDSNRCYGVDAYERARVVGVVIVATLH